MKNHMIIFYSSTVIVFAYTATLECSRYFHVDWFYCYRWILAFALSCCLSRTFQAGMLHMTCQ